MKLEIVRGRYDINPWILFSILVILAVILVVFIAMYYVGLSDQKYQSIQLNQECASYGQSLMQILTSNETLPGLNSSVSRNLLNISKDTVVYCYYSPSCADVKPVIPNSLSCLCDILQPNRTLITGLCMKQQLS